MASAATATLPKVQLRPRCNSYFQVRPVLALPLPSRKFSSSVALLIRSNMPSTLRLLVSAGGRRTFLPVSAVGSGQGSSVTEADRKSDLSLENVKTSVVSRDDEKINVRVQLPGKATQKVFDEALTFLARDAPPVPGFRKSKGGKTSNNQLSRDCAVYVLQIPSSILLQMLGKSRVTKFVLQEILSITIEEFVKKENLKVKPEIQTTQSEGEMESAFAPGSAFGFNVVLQLETPDSDDPEEKPGSDDDLQEESGSSE
ncbi:Trigger factor [Zea mays]|uniref:peptidylprolyl isomerase n=1 Tax=Zea mays TaxID=4577 RepID=A0A3L6FBN2_MAIZE|nr:Trigger factor [Zea mays]